MPMMDYSQIIRLKGIETKPWRGMLNYFRALKRDWDGLEALGYVTPRLISTDNFVETWEYSITQAGLEALEEIKRQIKLG